MKGFFVILFLAQFSFGQDLSLVRNNYLKAVNDKSICDDMIVDLAKTKDNNLFKGYLGAYQTIWANHVVNPFQKLSTFNKGKKNLDNAIKSDPKNIELRALRLSIQQKAPKFLGYNDYINEDTKFIKANLTTVQSQDLKQFITKLL